MSQDSFSDWAASLRMRDLISRMVREEVDRQRPPARYGRVYDFNRFSFTADVLFPGDTALTRVKMPPGLQPRRRQVVDGIFADLVRVEGTPGNLWITEVVNNSTFMEGPAFHRPTFRGGAFMQETVLSYFGGSPGTLPGNDESWYAGKWTNADSFGGDGLAVVEVVARQSFFSSVTKKYIMTFRSNDTGGNWRKCAALFDSGPWSGNDFELEVRVTDTSVEFRVRRTGWASGGFTPGGYTLDIFFHGEAWKKDETATPFVDTSTAYPVSFHGTASTAAKGPFHSPGMTFPRLAQHLLTGGGAVQYLDSLGILKWSDRFIVIGMGRNQYATEGFFDIPVPAGGVSIPVFSKSGVTTTTTATGGAWLGNWESLYYELPWGDSNTAGGEGNFRIVHYNGDRFQVPSHWVHIATKLGDDGSGYIKLGTGEVVDYSKTLTLPNSDWRGLPLHVVPSFRVVPGHRVILEGILQTLVARTITSSGIGFATLPAQYRPITKRIYSCRTDTGTGRIDVESSGNVILWTSLAANGWISLDGISFPREQ